MGFDISPAITGLVFSGALVVSAALFFKKLPSSKGDIPDSPETLPGDLEIKYEKWEIYTLIPICLSMYIIYRFYFRVFTLLAEFARPEIPNCVFALSLSDGFWVLPAFFLAMVSAAVPCHYVYAFLLRGRYDGHLFYQKLMGGRGGWTFYRRFIVCIVVITAVMIPLAANCYIRITPSEIVINPFFGIFEKRFTYYQVDEIRKNISAKSVNNRVSRVASHELLFSGGYTWSTRNTPFDMGINLENEIVHYISIKSGSQVVERDPYPATNGESDTKRILFIRGPGAHRLKP